MQHVRACATCGHSCRVTTYNRIYCSIRCRREAQYAKELQQHRARRGALWTDFWAEHGDVPTLGDESIPTRAKLVAK